MFDLHSLLFHRFRVQASDNKAHKGKDHLFQLNFKDLRLVWYHRRLMKVDIAKSKQERTRETHIPAACTANPPKLLVLTLLSRD
jgi:hypothetical protein